MDSGAHALRKTDALFVRRTGVCRISHATGCETAMDCERWPRSKAQLEQEALGARRQRCGNRGCCNPKSQLLPGRTALLRQSGHPRVPAHGTSLHCPQQRAFSIPRGEIGHALPHRHPIHLSSRFPARRVPVRLCIRYGSSSPIVPDTAPLHAV